MEDRLLASIRTPRKSATHLVSPSYERGTFDSHAVDCPFVFKHDRTFYMTFVGWDTIGYRTGLAFSDDLRHWTKLGMIIDRGPAGSPTEYNVALTSIMRDNALWGPGTLKQIDGRFVGTYHAYPDAGYESGPGAIGLGWSTNLHDWTIDPPVLHAKDGAEWERGGLYKSWLLEHDGTYYLFYNAKNQTEGHWHEQTGVAMSTDLRTWQRHHSTRSCRLDQRARSATISHPTHASSIMMGVGSCSSLASVTTVTPATVSPSPTTCSIGPSRPTC